MTAQELKNSILQLAVQGKLVPQDDAEVEVDIREIKLKSTEDLIFDIPQKWKTAHMECVCNSIPSKQYQILESEVRKAGQFPVISQSKEYTIGYSDVADKVFHHDEPVIVFGDHTTEVKYIAFDFVVGADGLKLFEPNTKIVLPLFFFYALQYYTIGLNKVGGYSRHYKYIKNKPIPLPPLAEQQRIVAKIEELMPLVEEYGKAEERLTALNAGFPDKLRKSILQQAIQGKLTERDPADEPASKLLKRIHAEKEQLIKEGKIKKEKSLSPISDDEIPFEIPENWQWVRLGYIADMCLGKMLDKAKNKGNLYPYLRNVNVRWGSFDLSDILTMRFEENETERYSVQYGDLVVCEGGEPGRCAVWADKQSSFRIQKALHRIRFYGDINSFFVFRLFELYAYNGYFAKRFTGSTIKHLPGAVLANILVPLPPITEQQRIVDRVNELIAVCDELK